mmetsp:Transcript_7485/g.8881  ORF Transcript_7485/g.8881 Transcript_7485/m.8881 type:complete len:524 (-) Transcript_7485:265-1836(-)
MEFLHGDYDEEDTVCVEDFLLDHPAPENGCLIHIHLSGKNNNLNAKIVIGDSASWEVPILGVGQESYAHRGYRGSIYGLLEKVIHDVDMMRSGYSKQLQPKFDKFLGQVQMLLDESKDLNSVEDIHLVVRDASGLSTTELLSNDDHSGGGGGDVPSQATISYFPRTMNEERDLNILDNDDESISNYTKIDSNQQLTTVNEIVNLIKKSNNIVVFSGAGISVESGVTPFRTPTNTVIKNSADENDNENNKTQEDANEVEVAAVEQPASSIWSNFDASKMTVFNFNRHDKDEDRIEWWKMKHSIIPEILNAKPNPAHLIFAKLHEQKKLSAVITQNIDSLHTRAGVPPEKVIELHGHMRGLICSDNIKSIYNPIPYQSGKCDYELSEKECLCLNENGIVDDTGDSSLSSTSSTSSKNPYFKNVSKLPLCPKCQSPLRTETVMFEQPMPYGLVDQASSKISSTDLLIIIGSTLIVKPACDLPLEALRKKIPVIIINPYDKTQYDEYATGLIREPAGVFMKEVMERL